MIWSLAFLTAKLVLNLIIIPQVKGKLTLVFNMGSSNVTLVEPRSVADGQYHKCVVHRQGMNATMRVDNWPIKVTSPDNGKDVYVTTFLKKQIIFKPHATG